MKAGIYSDGGSWNGSGDGYKNRVIGNKDGKSTRMNHKQ